MDTGEHHSKAKTIWLLVILFIFAISNTVWGLLYIKQSGENQQMSSRVTTLNSEKTDLDTKIKKLEVAQVEKIETQKKEETTEWREIPELGVKYKVTEKSEDLTYAYYKEEDGTGILGLSTLELTNAAPANAKQLDPNDATYSGKMPCSSHDPMAVITSSKRQFTDDFGEGKKVGTAYYRISFGKLNGSTKCSQEMLTALQQRSQALFDSLEPIEESS